VAPQHSTAQQLLQEVPAERDALPAAPEAASSQAALAAAPAALVSAAVLDAASSSPAAILKATQELEACVHWGQLVPTSAQVGCRSAAELHSQP
jgi:hypothetical protein